MAGILANSSSVTMNPGDTSPNNSKSGFLVGEPISLSVTPVGNSFQWSATRPQGQSEHVLSAEEALFSSTGSSRPVFTPDIAGVWILTCAVDNGAPYSLHADCQRFEDFFVAGATSGLFVPGLRAKIGTAGEVITVKGYASAGDGAEGDFQWINAVGTDNGGTILHSGGFGVSQSGYWNRIYSGSLNPAWFGAIGDGATDDTAALQRACAVIQANGGGSLLITKFHAIFASSHATPIGEFSNCTNIKLLCHGGGLILPNIEWATLGIWPAFSFTACSNIVIDGFTCSGGTLDHTINVGSGVILCDLLNGNGTYGVSMPHNVLSGAWTGIRGNQAYTDAESTHSRGINIGYLEVTGGTYGVNGRYSLDDMTIGMLKTTRVYRSLFMVGCKNVRAYVDSADHHGSHDVIFAAQEGWSVENCHVTYVKKRDTGGSTADNIGVFWQFTDLHNGSPKPAIRHCSTVLDVVLPANGSVPTVQTVVRVAKVQSDTVTDDTTIQGYTLHDFSIRGRVDMNDRGSQAVLLAPTDSWTVGEFASNINISDLLVLNSVATTRPVWFNIARALVGTMTARNITVDSGFHVELFGRSGAGPYYPPSDGLVHIDAVQADNRYDGSAVYALHQGAGYERIGGWSGIDFYKDSTQFGRMSAADADYLSFGAAPATAGNIRVHKSFSLYFKDNAGGTNRKLLEVDGGDNAILGNNATTGTYVDAGGGAGGVNLRAGGNTMFHAVSGTGVAFNGGTARFPSITGALSAVTDANAKAVLTSIIAALCIAAGVSLATDGTT